MERTADRDAVIGESGGRIFLVLQSGINGRDHACLPAQPSHRYRQFAAAAIGLFLLIDSSCRLHAEKPAPEMHDGRRMCIARRVVS